LLKHRNGKSAATRERGIQPIRPADEHPSGVYFVRCGDYVKIGYAERPSARTVELQTGNPVQLELARVVAGDPPLERGLCRAILVIHVPQLRERYAELVAVRA
jgi:hypothetical protein